MADIKILDCTLRDGGYNNNWKFGCENILNIVKNLSEAGVDFIECGFLKNHSNGKDYSLYSNLNQLEELYQIKKNNSVYCLMINLGEYDLQNLFKQKPENTSLRIAFGKQDINAAAEYAKELMRRGFKIFLNPKNFSTFSISELSDMIEKVNRINPFAFSIVDTFGSVKTDDFAAKCTLINSLLMPDIKLCFHSHNNLNLSFNLAKLFIKTCSTRDLIIDSSLAGMGRGAGNLKTEEIAPFLNYEYGKKYDLNTILQTIDYINYDKPSEKMSLIYRLSAIYNCHPNYAKFLIDRNILSAPEAEKILQAIPRANKNLFDDKLIKNLCT